jgi:hypothetical protein
LGSNKYGLVKNNTDLIKQGIVKCIEYNSKSIEGKVEMEKMGDLLKIEDVNGKSKTEIEQKIEDYINNIPSGKVSTPSLLANYIGSHPKHVIAVLKNKFKDCIKLSSVKRRLYVGKSEDLEKLK